MFRLAIEDAEDWSAANPDQLFHLCLKLLLKVNVSIMKIFIAFGLGNIVKKGHSSSHFKLHSFRVVYLVDFCLDLLHLSADVEVHKLGEHLLLLLFIHVSHLLSSAGYCSGCAI